MLLMLCSLVQRPLFVYTSDDSDLSNLALAPAIFTNTNPAWARLGKIKPGL